MEKAMQIKYQKKFCCNCGKWFNAKADRFLVCSCGNTDPMELNEKYGVINWGNNELMLAVLKAKLAVFSINDYTEIIPILCNLPIISGIEVKNKVKKLLPIEAINESAFANWRTWMIVSHFLHYNHSVLYKKLWESGNISVCEALIMECVPHTESISDDICNKINSLPTDIPQKILSLAISNIIEGMDAEVSLFLAKNNIEVYQFEEMLKKTGITPEQGIKDIKEYSVLSYEGQTILKQIGEYYSIINWFKYDLGDVCSLNIDEKTPIYFKLLLAKNQKNMFINNGIYAMKKLLRHYEDMPDDDNRLHIEMYGGLVMRAATIEEVKNCPLIIRRLPHEGIEELPYVILKKNIIESVVFKTVDNNIVIEGICDDTHKILANKFLESMTVEDADDMFF